MLVFRELASKPVDLLRNSSDFCFLFLSTPKFTEASAFFVRLEERSSFT